MEELILNHVLFTFKIGEAPDGGRCDEPPATMRLTGVALVFLLLSAGVPPSESQSVVLWVWSTPGQGAVASSWRWVVWGFIDLNSANIS